MQRSGQTTAEDRRAEEGKALQSLFQEIEQGNTEAVHQILTDFSHIINKPKEDGNTLLHVAVLYDRTECVRALIASGINLNAKNNLGHTALDIANMEGKTDCKEALEFFMPGHKSPKLIIAETAPSIGGGSDGGVKTPGADTLRSEKYRKSRDGLYNELSQRAYNASESFWSVNEHFKKHMLDALCEHKKLNKKIVEEKEGFRARLGRKSRIRRAAAASEATVTVGVEGTVPHAEASANVGAAIGQYDADQLAQKTEDLKDCNANILRTLREGGARVLSEEEQTTLTRACSNFLMQFEYIIDHKLAKDPQSQEQFGRALAECVIDGVKKLGSSYHNDMLEVIMNNAFNISTNDPKINLISGPCSIQRLKSSAGVITEAEFTLDKDDKVVGCKWHMARPDKYSEDCGFMRVRSYYVSTETTQTYRPISDPAMIKTITEEMGLSEKDLRIRIKNMIEKRNELTAVPRSAASVPASQVPLAADKSADPAVARGVIIP